MIINDSKHLLFVEPTDAPSALPVIDDITRKMVAAWRRNTAHHPSRGWHSCTGAGCPAQSDSEDHKLPDGRETNSMCIHYLAHHRSEIPAHQLAAIAALEVSGEEPTAAELMPRFFPVPPAPTEDDRRMIRALASSREVDAGRAVCGAYDAAERSGNTALVAAIDRAGPAAARALVEEERRSSEGDIEPPAGYVERAVDRARRDGVLR